MASLPLVQIFDSNGDELKQLEQWDSDRVLEFRGIDPFTLADIDVIHVGVVGHLNSPEAVPQVREDENSIKITLPGWKFTRYGQPLIFYGYEQMGAGELRTVFAVTMPLARRLKPISYSDAEWERQQAEIAREEMAAEMATATDAANTAAQAATDAADAANTAAERAEDAAEHAEEVIATAKVFIAEYGVTTIAEIRDALEAGKAVICRREFTVGSGTIYGEGTLRDMRGNLSPASVYIFDGYPWVYHLEYDDTWRMESVLASSPEAGNQMQLLSSGAIYDALQNAGKPPLKVTITQSGNTYTTDYSSAEIYAAWAEGRYVYAQFGRILMMLGADPTNSVCLFQATVGGITYTQFSVTGNTATRTERNIISRDGTAEQNTITSTLHLAYTPTVGGEAVNKEYVDGALDDYYTKDDTGALLDDKQDTLTFDTEPTENSTNPVTSGGVYTALQGSGQAPLVVTFTATADESRWTTDVTRVQIRAAYMRGQRVYGKYAASSSTERVLYNTAIDTSNIYFWTIRLNGTMDIFNVNGTSSATRSIISPISQAGTAAQNTIRSTLLLNYAITNAKHATTKQYVDSGLATKQNAVVGKGLSTNDYTNTDKAKVDAMPTATSDLTNDSDFQNSTEVNDAIAAALGSMTSLQYEIVTALPATGAAGTVYLIANSFGSYDEFMWIGGQYYNIGSTDADLSNYYTRAEVDTRLNGKQDTLIFDAVPTVLSTNPVTSGGVFEALADKQDTLVYDNVPTADSVNTMTSGGIYNALQGKQNALTFDPTPTNNSPNPVTSGGVFTALGFKQDVLVFDSIPTLGSPNPVTSAGVWSALRNKQDAFDFDTAPLRGSLNAVTSNGIYEALQGRTTPAQVQQAINDAMADFTEFDYAIVAALPAVGEKGVVYFVPDAQNPSVSNQFLWIEETPSGHYEQIGSTAVDLSDYYTKDEVDDLIDEVRVFQAQLNVTSAADIIQAVNDRKSIVVHMGAGSPSEFAVKAAISGEKVYLYTMTLNVGTDRSYPMFTRHVIEGTTWAVRNVGGAVTDDVPFIAEYGRTTPPQIEAATAKNRIIVVKTTGGAYYPCINVSTTADYHTRLHCLVGSYDATETTFGLALKVYDIYGATWTEYSTAMVTAADLQDAVDELNDRIDEVEATIGRFRGNYASYALLAADTRQHRVNDYAIVTVDETLANQCWYYTYSSDGVWVARFKVRDAAFTTAQLNAINSGATTAKIDSIALKNDKITTYEQSTIPTDSTKFSCLDGNNNQNNLRWTMAQMFQYFWDKIYPVGSIYTTTDKDFNPATSFGGTWSHVGVDRVLWGVSTSTAGGSTLSEQLPDIRGHIDWSTGGQAKTEISNGSGAFSLTNKNLGAAYPTGSGASNSARGFDFKASDYNSVYKLGGVVRPNAYTVHFWRRTA